MFSVGQLVVCIQRIWNFDAPEFYAVPKPVYGDVYTISGFAEDGNLYLVEFPMTPEKHGIRYLMRWEPEGFRPLRKTSIDVFERLLKTKSDKELVW